MKEGLNVVHLTGYVRGEPTMVDNKIGRILKFKLAVADRKKNGDSYKTVYDVIDIAMWGVQARNLSKVLQPGGLIYVGGKMRYSTYESKKLNTKVTTAYVKADKVLLLGRKSRGR